MKENNIKNKSSGICDGCGKHCSLYKPGCRYGEKLAAKLGGYDRKTPGEGTRSPEYKCRHKWEREVENDGLLWHYLNVGHRMKKLLRDRKIRESHILAMLNEAERRSLREILGKIEKIV